MDDKRTIVTIGLITKQIKNINNFIEENIGYDNIELIIDPERPFEFGCKFPIKEQGSFRYDFTTAGNNRLQNPYNMKGEDVIKYMQTIDQHILNKEFDFPLLSNMLLNIRFSNHDSETMCDYFLEENNIPSLHNFTNFGKDANKLFDANKPTETLDKMLEMYKS